MHSVPRLLGPLWTAHSMQNGFKIGCAYALAFFVSTALCADDSVETTTPLSDVPAESRLLGVAPDAKRADTLVPNNTAAADRELPSVAGADANLEVDLDVTTDASFVNSSSKMEFMPQFSIFNANTLSLRTADYAVDYGSVLEGVPIFHLSLAVPIHRTGNFQFLVNSQIGLGAVSNVFPVKWTSTPNSTTASRDSDRVRLLWMPISFSSEVRYSMPGIPFFQPSVAVGAGGHLLMQRGTGSVPDADFWVPHLFIRPALTFFDAATTAHWFGGFLFGVTVYQSVGEANRLTGSSFDLSLKFLL
jgi:hypothetical protein